MNSNLKVKLHHLYIETQVHLKNKDIPFFSTSLYTGNYKNYDYHKR